MTRNNLGLDWRQRVCFDPKAYAKIDLAPGQQLMFGLNTFLSRQAQAVHAHVDQDKFYVVLEGEAEMTLEADRIGWRAGHVYWAPAGLEHGLAYAAETPLVVLVGMAPPGHAK